MTKSEEMTKSEGLQKCFPWLNNYETKDFADCTDGNTWGWEVGKIRGWITIW